MPATVLTFTMRADTSQMEGQVKRAGAALEGLGTSAFVSSDQAEKAERKFMGLAKGLGLELSGAASATVGKLEALRDHLTRTGAPAADLEKVTLALAEADRKYAASLSNTVQQMGFWEKHGTAVANTAGIMGAAIFGFGVIAVKAFGESQKVSAQLDAVLKSTGNAAGVTKAEVLALADALSKVVPFDDEVIASGQALLLTFTGIGKDVLPRATKAMLDLAVATGTDVPTAARMLGKALDQPSEGFTALAKATGKFTDAQVASIKEMVAFGETGKAQAAVLDLVEKKVGGSGEAFGKTLPGQLAIAQTAAGNFNEEVGGKLVPTLQGLINEFPNVTAAVVGTKGAWDSLNISGGELLIALPLLKTAFAGTTLTMSGMALAAAPVTVGIVGIVAAMATIASVLGFWKAAEEQIKNMAQAGQIAQKTTATLSAEAGKYGITLQRGNESQEAFNARLFQAIVAYEKLHPEVKKVETATVQHTSKIHSHVITLQQQIDKQRALVESLSRQIGKDQELTDATAKLDAMLKTAGGSTKKLSDDMQRLEKQYATVTGAAVQKIEAIKQDIKFMEQHRGSTDALTGAHQKLEQATLDLIVSQSRFPELLKNRTVAHQTVKVAMLGEVDAVELLTMAYDKYLAGLKAFTEIDFGEVMISNNATLDAARNLLDDNLISLGKLNKMMEVETPKSLKPAEQGFKELGNQVSTIVTDLGKGIADALIKWQGFGKSMISIAKEFGTGILRTLIETWFKPLEGLLASVAGGIMNLFSGKGFSMTGGGGGLLNTAAGFGGLLGKGGGLAGLLGIGGGGMIAGGVGGSLASIAGAGAVPGFLLAGGTVAGTAGAAGVGTGLATGGVAAGAGSSSLMASMGAFMTNPWTIGIAAAIAGGIMITNKFTQRGRDKVTATGEAENLSKNVWENIIPDVKAGNLTIEEGIAAVNAAWASYEKFLRENVKDSVVVQRSLDTQRITLTQGLDALDQIKRELEAVALEESIVKLGTLGNQFIETGKMTEEFAKAVTDAGGSVDFFNKMAGEVQRLQILRNELGSLKQMVDSFLPKQKTWMENFIETGEITDEMAEKIREAGGDINQFKKFAEMKGVKTQFESLVAEFEKTGVASDKLLEMIKEFGGDDAIKAFEDLRAEAKASGKTIGELAKDSQGSAEIISGALEATAGGINKAFGDAAKTLSDTLAKMDENLGKAIGDLQNAMVVMLKNLIDVILQVPGAAEKAARDANFFLGGIRAPEIRINITTHFDDSGLREAERRAAALGGIGFTPQPGTNTAGTGVSSNTGGIFPSQEPIDPRIPRFQHGTDYVPRTGLAMLHKGEAVIPASQNTGSTQGSGITVINQFSITAVDPDGTRKVVNDYIIPAIVKSLDNNTDGSRATVQKALRLKQPGAF